MKSKFKVALFFIVIPAMVGLTYLTVLLWATVYRHPERLDGVMVMIIGFLTLTSLIALREAKFKWNKIEITENELKISPFFGLWTQRIRLSEVTGYTRSQEYSKTSPGHTIYIYVKQKRAIEISDAYYKNTDEIIAGLSGKVRKLGKENSSVIKHVLNAFGKPIVFRGN
ncbi:MAG TPA: hypothetical protein VFD46_13280 [Chryseolinea sp.]|nr:hypothetical protein [Chryseolinea sp.]